MMMLLLLLLEKSESSRRHRLQREVTMDYGCFGSDYGCGFGRKK